MKTLTYFTLDINKTNPKTHVAIKVNKVDVAAMNDNLIVIKNDGFTRINVAPHSSTEARTLSIANPIILTKEHDTDFELIFIDMYCHHSTRADFIRHCNDILAASAGYNDHYVNSLGDVIQINHEGEHNE